MHIFLFLDIENRLHMGTTAVPVAQTVTFLT